MVHINRGDVVATNKRVYVYLGKYIDGTMYGHLYLFVTWLSDLQEELCMYNGSYTDLVSSKAETLTKDIISYGRFTKKKMSYKQRVAHVKLINMSGEFHMGMRKAFNVYTPVEETVV